MVPYSWRLMAAISVGVTRARWIASPRPAVTNKVCNIVIIIMVHVYHNISTLERSVNKL